MESGKWRMENKRRFSILHSPLSIMKEKAVFYSPFSIFHYQL